MRNQTAAEALNARADEAAAMLPAMANSKRLEVFCALLDCERSVGGLATLMHLSPAALSQHMGKMLLLQLV
jgi:DNA-binding transcriptional ArsR family regulator